jgi:cell division inhibitor SepF
MGTMDKFLNYLKLSGEEEDDDKYYDDNEDDFDEEELNKKSKRNGIKENQMVEEKDSFEEPKHTKSKVTNKSNLKSARRNIGGSDNMEVCVIRPNSVEDAREITSTLLENKPVILNLEGIDVDVAQRIIDFTSGSCYAIDGNLQKISHYIFIITPNSVDIFGDLQDVLSDGVIS